MAASPRRPSFTGHSPTYSHFPTSFTPTNGRTTNGLSSVNGSALDRPDKATTSTYYDPTSDHGGPNAGWARAEQPGSSPARRSSQVSRDQAVRASS